MIKVTFPDGSQREYPVGTTSWDIAGSISPRLQQDVLAAGVNGQIWDLMRPLKEDTELKLYKWEDPEGKYAYWHSSAHLMAEALQALYPGVKFGIGPAIENGFYYDIDLGEGVQLRDADLAAIEAKMAEFAARKEPIIRRDITKALTMLEEAKKRDHRKIGKELGLFAFSQNVGSGLPLWLPRGTQLRLRLEDFLKQIQKQFGYQQVISPHIGSKQLYVTSGHWAKYGADSFRPITTPQEGEEFMLKPMNCPHHCEIFKALGPHSYRDLPQRLAEFGTVYRYEQSGELHGLTRVRGFTQDDAHLFCRPDQIKEEFCKVMDIIFIIFKALNFENFEAQISLRDQVNREKYIGSEENWERAEQAIIEACAEKGLPAKIEYGEAAFYGPKLDFMVKDALGRRWQLGTIQVDYNLPERFDLEYTGADNKKHRPVMIHRAPFGSMERFVAVLIEHTAGHFPLWLTPDQVVVLPISEKFNDYAHEVAATLNAQDIRTQVDDRNEKIGRKIRDNELKRIPYMLIVGEKEAQEGEVSVRVQGEGDKGSVKIATFAEQIAEEVHRQLNAWQAEAK